HDLYSPRYLKRKEILVEREASAGPVMTEGALRQARGSSAEAYPEYGEMPMAAAPPAAPPPPMGGAMLAAPLARSRARQMAASHKVETVAQSVGQLFEYRIDCPVTVRRNQSALVPIV